MCQFDQTLNQAITTSEKLESALRKIEQLEVKCSELTDENFALQQEAFLILDNLYKSYYEREKAFDMRSY